jgi:N-acetylglucosamine kinase-like BadF-type ATPase
VVCNQVRTFLGIDGGGSKTDFLLIDESGRALAAQRAGSAYYLETGADALEQMLTSGIHDTLRQAGLSIDRVAYAFIGLPAYGEDGRVLARLDRVAAAVLPPERYRCGNDMVCGWAGALAGADGINIVAGTGSIAYGEFRGRGARCGGWGELFSDEGSAYWFAREGLRLFSRMSDGRCVRGPLYQSVRDHFALQDDLELCAAVYGTQLSQRSQFAQLSKLVADAAAAGDTEALGLFTSAVHELAQMIDAVRAHLGVPGDVVLPVSYSGGLFHPGGLLLRQLESQLAGSPRSYQFREAQLPPHAGAAIYAAKLSGSAMGAHEIGVLAAAL